MTTTVVNVAGGAHNMYIGRKREGMHYGNPFSVHTKYGIRCATRKESIDRYREWLAGYDPDVEPVRRLWILANLKYLVGKRLGCYCKPLACHGDVLVEILETNHDN